MKKQLAEPDTVVLSLRVEKPMMGALKQQAKTEERTLANMVRRAIAKGLDLIRQESRQ